MTFVTRLFLLQSVLALACSTALDPSFRRENQYPVIPQRSVLLTSATSHILPQKIQPTDEGKASNAVRSSSTHTANGDLLRSTNLREVMVTFLNRQNSGDFKPVCRGSLISSTWVLTAAHCKALINSLAVVGNEHILDSSAGLRFAGGEQISVDAVFPHPDYSEEDHSRRANDIALVKLAQPASARRFMRLNMDPDQPHPADFYRVSGREATVFMDTEPLQDPGRFRQVDVPIFSNSRCNKRYGGRIFSDRHLCAGYSDRPCASCQGSSGGPIFQYDNENNPVQMGVISFGVRHGETGAAVVNVRTSAFRGFLESVGAEFTPGSNNRVMMSETSDRMRRPQGRSGSNSGIVAGVVVGVVIIIALLVWWYIRRRKKRAEAMAQLETAEGKQQVDPGQHYAAAQPVGAADVNASHAPPVQPSYPDANVPVGTHVLPTGVAQQSAYPHH